MTNNPGTPPVAERSFSRPADLCVVVTVVASIGFCLTLASRRPKLLEIPQIWAEDGAIFLTQAFEHGISSLLIPYAGYLHFMPRLIAVAAAELPIQVIPAVFVYSAAAAWLLVFGYIMSSSRPSLEKAGMGLAIALVPQSNEILFTITNIQWVFSLILIFALVDSSVRSKGRAWFEGTLVALAGLSGLFACLFAPVWLVSVLTVRRTALHLRYFAMIAVMAVIQFLLFLNTSRNEPIMPEGGSLTKAAWVFLSDLVANHLAQGKAIMVVQVSILVLVLLWSLRGPRRAEVLMTLGAGLAVYAAFLYAHRANPSFSSAFGHGGRYFFIPFVCVTWVLVVTLTSDAGIWRRALAALCLLWTVQSASAGWQDNLVTPLPWPNEDVLRASDGPLRVPINPPGHSIVIPRRE